MEEARGRVGWVQWPRGLLQGERKRERERGSESESEALGAPSKLRSTPETLDFNFFFSFLTLENRVE
jgi:hypothetical protein